MWDYQMPLLELIVRNIFRYPQSATSTSIRYQPPIRYLLPWRSPGSPNSLPWSKEDGTKENGIVGQLARAGTRPQKSMYSLLVPDRESTFLCQISKLVVQSFGHRTPLDDTLRNSLEKG